MSDHRVRPATIAALCITEFAALGALVVPAIIALQLRVRELESTLTPESRLSWVTTCGAVSAMLAGPIFGWLSDASARRHGHRATWIIGGAVAGLGCAVVAANVTTLPALVLAWIGVQVSYSATFAALFGSLSDFVPARDRARVSGLFAASGIASVAFGGALVAMLLSGHLGAALENPKSVFLAMAVLAVPTSAFTSWHLRSLGRAAGPIVVEPPAEKPGVVKTLIGAGGWFWWLLAQRVLVQAAYTCMTVYAVLYLVRRTGEEAHDAAVLVAIATAIGGTMGVLVAAGGARSLARRIGYKAALGVGILCLVTATALMSLSTSQSAFVVAHVLAGSGLGTYLALDLVVALTLLPTASAGRLLGYFTTARKIPQSVVPAIAPALLAIGSGDLLGVDRSQNYFALLIFGSALGVVALGLLGRLTVPDKNEHAPALTAESR
ncbi:MFS transporter [Nocardioides marmoriginsengisoli]|uniref:MFS transporter n=1 Tax=Nocardioides marmoriginsengisoli TaxID=661483 RepID=A0A3N0CEX6_9ACTN|nr:MFS transporter [Nocardioides marmoriginsengisoli]RNL62014.1 MFS transporter [Nocardioides marmoriginsengisoli]